MRRALTTLVFLALGGLAGTQRNACFQYLDAERDRCLAAAEVPHDDYERQRSSP